CNPTDPWAWVGLAGDCIDLIPFVTGVGEGVKGLRLLAKAADKTMDVADTLHDSTKVMDKVSDVAKLTKKTSGNNTRGLLSDFLGKPVNTQKGKFYSVMNESGGQVFVSTDNIVQSDISSIVSTVDGKINIISGRHGDWMDNIVLEPKFYKQDVKRFGNMKNVKVFNYGDMNPSQINNLINSGDTTILGWCYSEYSSFMRDAFR
ncbi:MAG: hypothetical protein IKY53_00985, partial [Lachnospiraceae bacterium]|nr:hypothetical protein [Lachnospiraceae bacterium]